MNSPNHTFNNTFNHTVNNTAIHSAGQINFARLDCQVLLPLMQSEITQLLDATWVDHVNARDYAGGWNILPLRCQAQHSQSHPVLQSFAIAEGDAWEDLPVMAGCTQIKQLLAQLQCPIKSVRLMRLCAGALIKPHRDQGLGLAFGEARLHMPVFCSDKVSFWVNEKLIPMAEGELWYFNADEVHAVENQGNEDRINLVIDCVANDWLIDQVVRGSCIG